MDDNLDAPSLTPFEARALIERQQDSIAGHLGAFVPFILLSWAIALAVGLGSLWLAGIGVLTFGFALGLASAVYLSALVISAVLGTRSGRGTKASAEQTFSGTVYGIAWAVAVAGLAVMGIAGLSLGLTVDDLVPFYALGIVFVIGLMYFVGGALWRAPIMVVLGAWCVVVAAIAGFFGLPDLYLVLGLGAGGGFLVMAVYSGVNLSSWRSRS